MVIFISSVLCFRSELPLRVPITSHQMGKSDKWSDQVKPLNPGKVFPSDLTPLSREYWASAGRSPYWQANPCFQTSFIMTEGGRDMVLPPKGVLRWNLCSDNTETRGLNGLIHRNPISDHVSSDLRNSKAAFIPVF